MTEAPTVCNTCDSSTPADPARQTYRDAVKATALLGGSTVLNVLFGIIRAKFAAVLLGPSGVGLLGMYTSVITTATYLAGMGLTNSGVRQIAEASAAKDPVAVGRAISILRLNIFVLGTAGTLIVAALAGPIGLVTFGNAQHTDAVRVLSLCVFFMAISAGQTTLLQGLRRIRDLARVNVLGAAVATGCSVPLLYAFQEAGIVPLLLIVYAVGVLTSWWYARKVNIIKVRTDWRCAWDQSRALLTLGGAFMLSGLLVSVVAYLTRVIITRKLGIEAVGQFQAAWLFSNLYVGIIIQAMSTDFFPKLTALAQDNREMNRTVNQQVEVSVLLAAPGVIATLVFAPWVIHAFYSSKFDPAAEVLRWQVLGLLLRIVSWPVSYIMLARKKTRVFMVTEVMANGFHILLVYLGVNVFGIAGAGMAYLGLYVFYLCLMMVVARKETSFAWSKRNAWCIVSAAGIASCCSVLLRLVQADWAVWVAAFVAAVVSGACFWRLTSIVPEARLSHLAHWVQQRLPRFRSWSKW